MLHNKQKNTVQIPMWLVCVIMWLVCLIINPSILCITMGYLTERFKTEVCQRQSF